VSRLTAITVRFVYVFVVGGIVVVGIVVVGFGFGIVVGFVMWIRVVCVVVISITMLITLHSLVI
jgi:hypothetical protein